MTTNNDFCDKNEEKPNDYVKKSHNEQTLTEQWKKGELVRGCLYYVKLCDSIAEVLLDGDNDFIYNGRIITPEVLSPVPSYEQWQSLNEIIDSMNDTNNYT